jgi:hypothetical protein
MNTLFAFALIIAGVILLMLGFDSSDSIQNSVSKVFTGHSTSRTTWLVIGGAACLMVALVGGFRGKRT